MIGRCPPWHTLDEPHPFALETATPHYAADRAVRARHVGLTFDLDFGAKSLGEAALTLHCVADVDVLTFDAVERPSTTSRSIRRR